MNSKADPWYIHAALYAVIVILIFLLVKVAVIDPKEIVEEERYYKRESRLRMENLKEAEILWQKKYGMFTNNVDSLILFVKNDPMVDSIINAFDSLSRRPANPFVSLSSGEFVPDSLGRTPKSQQPYIVLIDTSTQVDTVINQRGKILRVDSAVVVGELYYIEDPDGYGTVGSIDNAALKNSSSWE
ncbi:MAG: hypothetical protein R6W90_05560 [Ignavibacteriaceae bacterium]